jgi:hypothetical protein
VAQHTLNVKRFAEKDALGWSQVFPNLAVYIHLRDNVLRGTDFDYDVLAHQKSRSEGTAAQDPLPFGTELGVEPREYLVHIYLAR